MGNNMGVGLTVIVFLVLLTGCVGSVSIPEHSTDGANSSMPFTEVELSCGDAEGVIVPKEYDVLFSIPNMESRFTPSHREVREAEKILREQYGGLFPGMTDEVKRQELLESNRQYIGYINGHGERVLIVVMLNFSTRAAKRRFSGWKHNVIVGAGPFYERNLRITKISLEDKKLKPL